ncbi:penicillopepsin [Naviculisporaceae sp. PSN 640]
MRLLLLTVLLLGLLGQWVTGAPTRIQKRSFRVERVKNQNFKGRNGPRELFKAYRKHHMPLPPALLDALRNQTNTYATTRTAVLRDAQAKWVGHSGGRPQPQALHPPGCQYPAPEPEPQPSTSADAGIVAATPIGNDIEYLAPVTIGGQTLNLDFDTGSSDLWVFSTQLPSTQKGRHDLFDPRQSRTFNELPGHTFSIMYGDGSGASGMVGTDLVDIGGVRVNQQAVELATEVSQSFVEDMPTNGLLGLAFSQLNAVTPNKQQTFFENVLPDLAEPLFTADLRHDTPGAYEFGRVDASKFTGDLTWIPINKTQGFWQFSTSSFGVDTGAGIALQQTQTGQAIADTGTTLMVVSQEISDGYYSKVPGAQQSDEFGGVTFPCDVPLPDLFVDVGGVYTARIKGDDINFARVQGNRCYGGVQPATGDLQIWGDVFFKSQFVVFNGGDNTLGMAEHA